MSPPPALRWLLAHNRQSAADTRIWYVYCEGDTRQGEHSAVFSENFWSHPLTRSYGHEVAAAAKAFFKSRHNVQLNGCAGVNFADKPQ